MSRLLGLDYGNVRIGIAVGDPSSGLATPHSVICHQGWRPTARAVKQLAGSLGAETLVMGLPYTMEGQLGDQAQEVLGFAEVLKQEGLTVILQDERLSSFEAEERLQAAGKDARQIKTLVDQVAAAIILQSYLDKQRDTV